MKETTAELTKETTAGISKTTTDASKSTSLSPKKQISQPSEVTKAEVARTVVMTTTLFTRN